MPKDNKPTETDPDQSERFREALRELEAAGELNRTAADRALNELSRTVKTSKLLEKP